MLIAYDKVTGVVLWNSGTNSSDPGSVLIPAEVVAAVTGRENAGVLRLNDDDDADVVAKLFTHAVTVKNGKVVIGALLTTDPVEETPPPVVPPVSDEKTAPEVVTWLNTLTAAERASIVEALWAE